ncbi:radical SAM family heme chaperone HemW [Lunatibacter salilacus]|uniref:radical SAM family heme chaperone HemW n=1 Tax=Lunatibacter salilacus TaxID=2483804 RepID=UPI00131D5F98|nr:radical SAM family heme chaperone HemW [Lunatibacter salilacus]
MAGIYLHIPFCKKACHYCDFHFSTSSNLMEELIHQIGKELVFRKNYLPEGEIIESIYFGGGTPSLLSQSQLSYLMDTIHANYPVKLREVTLEANPDDLNDAKLTQFLSCGIDRLSIGIQSFRNEVLTFYNRAHNAEESLQCIELARNAGFAKLSIDLMYGFPSLDHTGWEADLRTALDLDPGHISSYALTIEPRTALGTWVKRGTFQPASDDFVAEEFEILQDATEAAGYIQYEISNFGKPDAFALHNTNYWTGAPYLGVGPSAHSFDGTNRGYNVSNNSGYVRALREGKLVFETDNLNAEDRINEYILTSLRTIWGTDLNFLETTYQVNLIELKSAELNFLSKSGWVSIQDGHLILSRKGKLLADSVAAKLFL